MGCNRGDRGTQHDSIHPCRLWQAMRDRDMHRPVVLWATEPARVNNSAVCSPDLKRSLGSHLILYAPFLKLCKQVQSQETPPFYMDLALVKQGADKTGPILSHITIIRCKSTGPATMVQGIMYPGKLAQPARYNDSCPLSDLHPEVLYDMQQQGYAIMCTYLVKHTPGSGDTWLDVKIWYAMRIRGWPVYTAA